MHWFVIFAVSDVLFTINWCWLSVHLMRALIALTEATERNLPAVPVSCTCYLTTEI